MQIIVQDLLINYEHTGSGKTVLLVHGWSDRLQTFQAIIPSLSERYSILALDLPGFGKSQAPKDVWNLDNYAQLIADFMKKVKVDDDLLAVVGHSNGGAVAIRGVALGLLSPKKLVLLSSSGVRDTAKIKRLVVKIIAKTGKVAAFWLPQKTKKRLQKKLYGTVGSDMLVTPELKETFKKTVRQDIQADAARIELPTLLIYGDQDKATSIDVIGKKLHRLIKGSRLESVSGADHFVHQAESEQVGALLIKFLQT